MHMSEQNDLPRKDNLGEDNEQLLQRRRAAQTSAPGAGASKGNAPGSATPAYANRRAAASDRAPAQPQRAAQNAPAQRTPAPKQTPTAAGAPKGAPAGAPAYATRRNSEAGGGAANPAPTMKVQNPASIAPGAPAGRTAAAQPKTPATAQPRPAASRPTPTPVPVVRPQDQDQDQEIPPVRRTAAAAGAIASRANPVDTKTQKQNKAEKEKKSTYHLGREMMSSSIKALTYIVLVLVVSVFISVFVIRVGNDMFAFVKSDDEIEVIIPEDATTADVAQILADNNIISHPGIFKMYAAFKKEEGNYIAGTYTVSPSMSYDALRREFKPKPAVGTSWITIPEGYTTDEIIDLMVSYGIGTREGYVDAINNYDFDYWFIDALEEEGDSKDRYYRLDGYLFPDTYEFYNSSSEVTVIDRMLQRFGQVFVEDYRTRAKEIGMSVDDVLTLASLIEKEAGGAEDYRIVSSVFHNRLNHPWDFPRLESDATVVYAIQMMTGERPTTITPEDNQNTDNPYNTYLYEGLPPGPITNPSASAIRYALYPMDSTYYYFISADNGTTLYASNWPQHQQNIETVRQMNAQYAATTGE